MEITTKLRKLTRNIVSFRKDKMNRVGEIRKEDKGAGKKPEA